MHFEVPKAKTFKEFGSEYLMIVVSIITALALEHTVQTLHHRHLAHEAAVKIDAEIQANIQQLDATLIHNNERVAKLNSLRTELLTGILDKTDDATLLKQLQLQDRLNLAVHTPTLRREAWEVAVASQAVSWMPREQLERYSSVYAGMRDMQATVLSGSNNFLNGPQMQDTISNLQMKQYDAKGLYRILRQMISAYDSTDGNLQSLRDDLAKAAGQH